jgi:hypothetical protein
VVVPAGAVATWIASAAVSDVYSRAVTLARTKDEGERLRDRVRDATGHSFPAKRFYRWYDLDATWDHLVDHTEKDYYALCADLEQMLWEKHWWLHRSPSPEDRTMITADLVEAVIDSFMQSLDASTAVAVHDYRSERRHAETIAAIEQQGRVDERLDILPPPVRNALQVLRDRREEHFAQVLDFVETNMRTPGNALDSVTSEPSSWLKELSGSGLVVLAEFAATYHLARQASELFERAATLGVDAERNLGRSALFARQAGEAERANELAERCVTIGDDETFGKAVRAAVAGDDPGVISALDPESLDRNPFLAGVFALALFRREREGEAIAALRHSVSARPDLISHELLLANILADRAAAGRSPTRAADLAEAIRLALHVRDTRRRWRGPSAEAVVVACEAAAADYDTARIFQFGCPPPDGEATKDEAEDDRVRHFVARGRLTFGQLDEAQAIAAQIGDRYLHALIVAKACLVAQPQRLEEGRTNVARAWALATDDGLRFDALLTGAGLGMDPLPGEDWIGSLPEDLQALLFAQREHVVGRSDEAMSRLRQHEGTSEHCAILLAQILSERGSVDEAVAELRHAADRFERPALLINAAVLLTRADRHDGACDVLLEVLTKLAAPSPERRVVRELLLELYRTQQNWQEMEQQARAMIAEFGPETDVRWMLVGAIWNQGRAEAAWRAATSDTPLESEDAMTAALWAQLHCRFDPSRATILRTVDLLERHIEEENPATAIVQALLTVNSPEEPEPDEQARWNSALNRFLEQYPNNPSLIRLEVGENLEELLAFMRASLEPTAKAFDDLKSKVASGLAPYGSLSALENRPYAAALLHRAAGCLLIYQADRGRAALERAGAATALGRPVAVDPSALVVASFTDGLWTAVQSSLGPLTITEAGFRDIVAAKAFCGQGDGLSVGWDASSERLVLSQTICAGARHGWKSAPRRCDVSPGRLSRRSPSSSNQAANSTKKADSGPGCPWSITPRPMVSRS